MQTQSDTPMQLIVNNPTDGDTAINVMPLFDYLTTTYTDPIHAIESINQSIANLTMMVSNEYEIKKLQEHLMPLIYMRDMIEALIDIDWS